jgi:hypothetical protein
MGSPSSTASSNLFPIQPQVPPASVHWLDVSIYILLFKLPVGHLGGQPCQAYICKYTTASVTVSVLGASPRAGSQFWPFTEPSLPQSPLHLRTCSSFRHEQLWVRALHCGIAIPFHHLMPCPSTGDGLHKFPLSTISHFI